MRSRVLIGVLGALAVFALAGCQTKVVTAPSGVINTVTAQGEGKTSATPDQAEMTFGATVTGSDAKKTLAEAATTANAITAALKKAGIAEKDLQTAGVNLYPQQDFREGRAPVITGYQASVQVRATIHDIGKVGDVISAASGAGATDIGGPSFTLSEDSTARAEAIRHAVADARARAEVMAKAAGKSLGDVVSVSETGASVPVVWGERAYKATDAAGTVDIQPGSLDITAEVTVVFELR